MKHIDKQIYYWAHMLDEAMDKIDSERSTAYASSLAAAKIRKDDEFYTTYDDADLILRPFSDKFAGKRILMNCDDPMKSEMFRYMNDNFAAFKLAELSCIGYGCATMLVVKPGDDWDEIPVTNNGDFRTGESLEALKSCNIVISNPPFSRASVTDKYSLGQDFFRLAIENKKDVIGINDVRNVTSGILRNYIVSGKLKVYDCPYSKFDRPANAQTSNNEVRCFVLSTIKNIDGVQSGLKNDLSQLFREANNLGLQYSDLPEYPLAKLDYANDRRIDVRILNLTDYRNNSVMPIPHKPSSRELYDGIQRPLIAIPYYWILGYNWEKYFKLLDIRAINSVITRPNTSETIKINNSYCIFEYR